MNIQKVLVSLFLTLFFSIVSFAQQQSAFHSLIYPRSISSGGMGEQGVASRNVSDAMQYNPADLLYSDDIDLSYFNNPWNLLGWHIPIASANVSLKLENGAAVGIDYTYWNFGEVTYTTIDQNPNGYVDEGKMHLYERSIAAGYAMPVGEGFAVGIQARYAWMPYTREDYIQHLLFSAGVSATPEIFSDRVTIGFSLMNFSTAIKYNASITNVNGNEIKIENADSPPSQINLGIQGMVVTNDFFDVSVALGAMKPVVKRNGNPDYDVQSSFSAFFNDWSDFPNDATAQAGLGFLWQPIDLGGGTSFFQEMYLGYFTVGPAEYLNSFMTHGAVIGIRTHGITASAGYAGRWHNYYSELYSRWEFPWETVQFSLSVDPDIFGEEDEMQTTKPSRINIVLSAGYAYGDPVGKFREKTLSGVKYAWSMKSLLSFESDFYFTGSSALHTALRYSRFTETLHGYYSLPDYDWQIEIPIETVSLESGFRYHPLDEIHPLFLQASLGIIRMNPVLNTSPRYNYQMFDELAVGVVLPVMNTGVVLMPKIGLKTIFMRELFTANRFGGYNQFTFGVNMGYEL